MEMDRLRHLLLRKILAVTATLLLLRPACSQTSSESFPANSTVVNGVLGLISDDAFDACGSSCETGLADAFGVLESAIACLCPELSSTSRRRQLLDERRRLVEDSAGKQGVSDVMDVIQRSVLKGQVTDPRGNGDAGRGKRYLRALAEEAGNAAFAARIPGGLEEAVESLELFMESAGLVAVAFGVSASEVEFSTLTVTPQGTDGKSLSVVARAQDASDVLIIGGSSEASSLMGGSEGVALFVALLVLVAGTFCCSCCIAFALFRSSSRRKTMVTGTTLTSTGITTSGKRKISGPFFLNGLGGPSKKPSASTRSGSSSTSSMSHHRNDENSASMLAVSVNGMEDGRPPESPSMLTPVLEGTEEDLPGGQETSGFTNPLNSRAKSGENNAGVNRRTASYVSSGAAASALVAGVGAGGEGGFPAGSHDGNTSVSSFSHEDVNDHVNSDRRLHAEGLMLELAPGQGSGEGGPGGRRMKSRGRLESRENPLYKVPAPLPAPRGPGGPGSAGERSAAIVPMSGKTGRAMESSDTPTRGRFETLLGTPRKLRKLAGRAMSRSPAHHRSVGSGGSSTRSSRRRRERSFPAKYDQKNSSEMDHQRPPADPVYTYMIKTIAAKGFKFMTTTEIAFCAMRMYSHFRRTQGNFRRLAMMKHAESVPLIYDIIWRCDTAPDGVTGGRSRFFSSSRGTDAEQQKSLLACLLALNWDGTSSSQRALRTALSPTGASEVPEEEDIFWDDFKDSTDALSGDDAIVVLSRAILLVGNSSMQPGESPPTSGGSLAGGDRAAGGRRERSTSSMMMLARSAAESSFSGAEAVKVDHGDIMRALSGANLREVGIAIKATRPRWQEAYVQLVSAFLVMDFLEEGARNTPPGGEGPDALSSLDHVASLRAEALDSFLSEKLEARRSLVELDLEPSGLVIRHDDEGGVEGVEPAAAEQVRIVNKPRKEARSSSRSKRSHRRSRSENASSVAPVVITTVTRRHHSGSDHAAGRPPSVCSNSSATSNSNTKPIPSHSGLRTIAQVKASPASIVLNPSPSTVSGRSSGDGPPEPRFVTTMTPVQDYPQDVPAAPTPTPAEDTAAAIGVEDGAAGLSGYAGVSTAGGESAVSEDDRHSETSSVVTRVFAPSHAGDSSRDVTDGPPGRFSSLNQWHDSRRTMETPPSDDDRLASPMDDRAGRAMSQISCADSRFDRSPIARHRQLQPQVHQQDQQLPPRIVIAGSSAALAMGMRSPSDVSVAASRFEDPPADEAAGSASMGGAAGATAKPYADMRLFESSPSSAAGSRFPDSPSSYAASRLPGSPTRGAGVDVHHGPYTGRSEASSIRSGSFFPTDNNSSAASALARSETSGESWDEEDVHTMGAQWLNDRAYTQQYSK